MPRSAAAFQRIFALAFVAALGLLLATPRQALAHLHLRHSSPAAKAVLDTVPRELRLVFTEAPQLAVSSVRLLAPDGSEVELGKAFIDPDSATALVAGIAATRLSAGSYTVVWRTASSDGHPMEGRFSFTIAEGAVGLAAAPLAGAGADESTLASPESAAVSAPASAGAASAATALPTELDIESPVYVAIRWLGYAALFGLIGAVVFVLVVAPRVPTIYPDVAHVAAHVAVVASLVLIVAWIARLVAQSYALGHVGIGAILGGTSWGQAWIIGAAASLVALGSALIASRSSSRAGWLVAALAALAATVALPLSGHAVATPHLSTLAVAADALHVIGAGGWLGTLLVTVVAGLPVTLRGAPGARGREASALISAFSPVALSCAGLLVATGVVAATLHLGSLDALWGSRYGQVLLIKLAVIAVLLVVAFINWRILRPALGTDKATRRIRGSAVAELGLAVIVLVVTAVLVATPPPAESATDTARVNPFSAVR
ncbi:MAG TPA: copper resistance protein CopC [Gemmatimonadaceae bacterium]|nr:copper resistance protein CopC [Gemmatimonadaceae bacterium]